MHGYMQNTVRRVQNVQKGTISISMSSSSESEEDEELKRAAAAVDPTFLNSYQSAVVAGIDVTGEVAAEKRKSERHLVTESHYNDVRVPDELQRSIARKLSAVIEKNVEFVPPRDTKVKRRKIKGGVKLFSCSTECLNTDLVVEDTETQQHNQRAKERKRNRKRSTEGTELTEQDKLSICAVTADHIQSGDDTKHWKSRRKEKLYKYKKQKNSKMLISLDDKSV